MYACPFLHISSSLDVGCFSPLKTAYGKQIEEIIQAGITPITKETFFPAFFMAYQTAMTEKNIQAGFRGADVVPFDSGIVISQLDTRFKRPTPKNSLPTTPRTWFSKTTNNPIEAPSLTELIKNQIARHQNSSPTAILDAVDFLAKGSSKIMHQLALSRSENQILRRANEELSKCRKAKKVRLRKGGSVSLHDGQDLQEKIEWRSRLRKQNTRSALWQLRRNRS